MPSTQSNWYVRLGCLAPIVAIFALFYFLQRDQFLPGFVFFAVFFGFAVLFLSLATRTENKVKEKQLQNLETFKPASSRYEESHSFVSYDLLSKIAIDEQSKRIYFWQPAILADGKRVNKAYLNMPYEISDYAYDQLLAIELYENGVLQQAVVNEASTGKLEVLGQSIDPAERKNITGIRKAIHRKIVTVELKLVIDDQDQPVRVIRFYSNLDKRLKRESTEYNDVRRKVDHWVSLLSFVMENRTHF